MITEDYVFAGWYGPGSLAVRVKKLSPFQVILTDDL